ncbi:hypothetical protein KFE98_19650 [bacterium SCSIO 12741]|nr:hypothetical protein KFE98_19650 [bacterium SCSIO 12741]
MKKLIIFLGAFCLSLSLSAGKEVVNTRLAGNDIKANAKLTIADGKHHYMDANPGLWPSEFTNVALTSKVILGIDPYQGWTPSSDYTCTVEVAIRYWNEQMTEINLPNQQLEVTFPVNGSPVVALDKYVFEGAIKTEITVVSVSDNLGALENVFIDLEIHTERYYKFDYANFPETNPSQTDFINSFFQKNYDANAQELIVSWDAVTGAEAFEFEWIYLADKKTGAPDKLSFDERSTRIRTHGHSFAIPMVYTAGDVAFRIRPLYYSKEDNYARLHPGRWIDHGIGTTSLAQYPSGAKYNWSTSYEETMTWQFQMGFNEMGNTSQSVVYADAAGNPRQSITRNNEEDEVVVTSVIFDAYSRPVMEILPSPVATQSLKYVNDLNLYQTSSGLEPLHFSHFDTENRRNNWCVSGPISIDPSSAGAGNYYSSSNPNKDGAEKYLPDAGGYPYVQMEYRKDNTGTVMRTSGVGENHQFGSGHDVYHRFDNVENGFLANYFPLLNYDVGASHTQRITRDANRVTTQEVYNSAGQIILKQVGGTVPSNLQPLAGNSVETTTNLLIDLTDHEYYSETEPLLYSGSYELKYDLTYDHLLTCNLCYTCHYEFVFKVTKVSTDECNQQTETVLVDYSAPIGSLNVQSTCPNPVTEVFDANRESGLKFFISPSEVEADKMVHLEIKKEIKVSEESKDYYKEQYLANYCGSDPETHLLDMTPDNCNYDFCTYEFYSEYGTNATEYNTLFGTTISQTDYENIKAEKIADCKETPSRCEILTDHLKSDFAPGNQYALYDNAPSAMQSTSYSHSDPYSLFNTDVFTNLLRLPGDPNQIIDYKYFNGQYTKPDGSLLSVNLNTVEDFMKYYHDGWLDLFLPAHPEYACLDFVCGNKDGSTVIAPYEYADKMNNTLTFDEARSSGLLNPLNLNFGSSADMGNYQVSCSQCGTAQIDEYFTLSGSAGTAYLVDLKDWIKDTDGFYDDGASTPLYVNIYVAAYILAACDQSTPASINSCINAQLNSGKFDLDNLGCDKEKWWIFFRGLYLQKRNLLVNELLKTERNTSTCQVPNGKEARISTFEDLFGSGFDVLRQAITTTPTVSYGTLQNNINSGTSCSDVAESMADDWMAEIGSCGLSGSGTQPYDDIREAFKQVFINSCQNDHPLGAQESSVPYSVSINGNMKDLYSFEDVLTEYGVTQGLNCSVYLIDAPQVGTKLGANGQLDACGCDALFQNEQNFANASYTKPDGLTTESELFDYDYGYRLNNLEELKCVCNSAITSTWTSGYSWSAAEKVSLESSSMMVPAGMGCPTSITCKLITDERTTTSGVVNYASEFPGFASSSNDLKLFTRYMNQKYGVVLTEFEYDQIQRTCAEFDNGSNVKTLSWTLTEQADDLVKMLDDLAKFKDLKSNSLVLKFSHDFYYGSLYDQQPLSANPVTLTTTQSNGVSQMIFTDNGYSVGSCTLDLDEPTTPYDLDDITGFELIKAVINTSTASLGKQYGFQIKARFKDGASEWLEGNSTCWPTFENLIEENSVKDLQFNIGGVEPHVNKKDCGNRAKADGMRFYALRDYENQKKDDLESFLSDYVSHCSNPDENLLYDGQQYETAITLFYYDNQGQLVKTVSPEGVNAIAETQHKMETFYEYNTLGEMTYTQTPDGGETYFWYDHLGRMVASQNDEQKTRGAYSYSQYDNLGRVVESGEISSLLYSDANYNSSPGEMTDIIARTPHLLELWFTNASTPNSGNSLPARNEVVRTIYDDQVMAIENGLSNYFDQYSNPEYKNFKQKNILSRVVSVVYFDEYRVSNEEDYKALESYDRALHYSYDVHGNVTHYIQDDQKLEEFGHDKKIMEYEYDLITNQVTSMSYQKGEVDQLIHRYLYDANEKLREAFVSKDGQNWDRIADYKYLRNGMLAREEIGQQKVQASDYVYTIQGWLKGVNASTLVANRDVGKDSDKGNYLAGQTNLHEHIGKDVYGYELKYNNNDYNPIDGALSSSSDYFLAEAGTNISNALLPQYNGNIAATTMALSDHNGAALPYYMRSYEYDQLYRLKKMHNYSGSNVEVNNSFATASLTEDYQTEYSYNRDGDLLSLSRNAYGSNREMDRLSYYYTEPGTHKLDHVTDDKGQTWNVDIGTQTFDNYTYNELGQLIGDKNQEISSIDWNISGKVRRVNRESSSTKDDISFEYGPMGNRWYKSIKPRSSSGGSDQTYWDDTYYVRDPQGNILAAYSIDFETEGTGYIELCETHLDPHSSVDVNYNNGSVMVPLVATNPVFLTGNASAKAAQIAAAINGHSGSPNFTAAAVGNCVRISAASGTSSELIDVEFTLIGNGSPLQLENLSVTQTNSKQLHLTEHHFYGSKRIGVGQNQELLAEIEGDWEANLDKSVEVTPGTEVLNQPDPRIVHIRYQEHLGPPSDNMAFTNISLNRYVVVNVNGAPIITQTLETAFHTLTWEQQIDELVNRINTQSSVWRAHKIFQSNHWEMELESKVPQSGTVNFTFDLGGGTVPFSVSRILDEKHKWGTHQYEFSNHLGNVVEVVSDAKESGISWVTEENSTFQNNSVDGFTGTNNTSVTNLGAGLRVYQLTANTAATTQKNWTVTPGKKYQLDIRMLTAGNCQNLNLQLKDGSTVLYDDLNQPNIYLDAQQSHTTTKLDFDVVDGNLTLVLMGTSAANTYTEYTVSSVHLRAQEATSSGSRSAVLAYNDYYPFGMVQPGRTYNHGAYRYGFQGQEYDREWKNGATSSQVPDYFYVDVMDNDLVFEDDFNDLSQWTVSNHGNGSCASLGAGGGLVLDTEDAWCGVQSVEFDVESGKSYWLGIDVDKPASHAGAEVVVFWDYWDAGNNQWSQLGVLVINQTGRHSTGMWRATGSTKLRMRLLPGGNVSSSNPCKATFYGIAVREQLTNWTSWHNSQGDLNLIGQGGRLRLQNDQNSGGGHSKEIAITNKGVPHTVTYNVERVTPNDANNNYSCHIIIEHRDAGGSWTELDYSARYISYDPEIKTITKTFTPTKDYIRFYVTSISSNPYPAPIEFYMDNIRITDGSTVPIASNGGGDMVSYKYRIHDPHIGRFLSLDPLAPKYPHNSPYAFSENRVIDGVELEGLEVISVHADGRFSVFATISVSAGFVFDMQGNVGVFITPAGGGGLIGGYSAGGGVSFFPTGNTIYDTEGWGLSALVSGIFGGGLGGSADGAFDTESLKHILGIEEHHDSHEDNSKLGGTVFIGGGKEVGGALEVTYTWVWGTTWKDLAGLILGFENDEFNRAMVNGLRKSINYLSEKIQDSVNELGRLNRDYDLNKNEIEEISDVLEKLRMAKQGAEVALESVLEAEKELKTE